MIATETETKLQNDFDLDRFYDAAVAFTGQPPEIALFDPQLAASFDSEVLIQRAEIEEGVNREEVESIVAEGLIRVWVDNEGTEGFLPYSARQVGVFQKLKKTGRYSVAELQHIAECWRDYMEAVVIGEPPYDDRNVPDFEHFRRRVAENVSFFEEEVDRGVDRISLNTKQALQQFELAQKRLLEWQRVAGAVAGRSEETLGAHLRSAFPRQLLHFRWQDEHVRLLMAQKFETKILAGYSVQVTFDGMRWESGEITFSDIDWELTFQRVRDLRREGRFFPLRTPEFNVTQKGVELLRPLTPEQYADLYVRNRMKEMFGVMEERGSEIWSPPPPPLGDCVCQECNKHFNRQMTTQLYCGERCRIRAKNRRWREKDPERARQCQARYWKSYGDVN